MSQKGYSIKKINAGRLLEKIPVLSISGEESSVDMILFEVLSLLNAQVGADIGQVNLASPGGQGGEALYC
ncbi:MAG: hypothetical protein COX19_15595 [Desulfobacterales bacterium CG23_combo_of_CG06-09_8_20_14_all_51_8]|nr:MAG: hypothetical protein COX19_15595 [Desulfobacterales bacterium CG23_combo_of_CG06-09_8_20_14_all_51_8]